MESANLALAKRLLVYLKKNGVKKLVVCPGSRNAPLIFTLQKHFDIFHHHDERAAAFFALGLIQSSHEPNHQSTHSPVAVLTTSGTAVAEMLPATIEAYYQKLPLILISADRPQCFRGTGAPQAIEHVGIFSHYADTQDIQKIEDFADSQKFPLHLNICLEEPRSGDWPTVHTQEFTEVPWESSQMSKEGFSAPVKVGIEKFCRESQRLLVAVGTINPAEASYVAPFLAQLRAPILADTSSNLSFPGAHSPYLLKCGEKLLKTFLPSHVLRLGSVPSFRFWRDLEVQSLPVLSVDVSPSSERNFSGLARSSESFVVESFQGVSALNVESREDSTLLEEDLALSHSLEKLLKQYPRSEPAWVRRLQGHTKGLLYLGNSLPIREWNLVNGVHACAFANRGANGIDGQLSTFLGLADGQREAWALVGDQTALYDLNALVISNQRSREQSLKCRRRIVVMNNRGGKIFSHLNYSSEIEASQRQLIENQHRWEFRPWAEMFGWAYESWEGDQAPISEEVDDLVIEIFPDAAETQHFWSAWRKFS